MKKINEKLAQEFGLRLRDTERLIELIDSGYSIEEIAAGIRGFSLEELESFHSRLKFYRERAKNSGKTKKYIAMGLAAVIVILFALPGIPYLAGLIGTGLKGYDAAMNCYAVSDKLSITGSFFNAEYMAKAGVYMKKAEHAIAKRDRISAAQAFAMAGQDYLSKEQYYLAGKDLLEQGQFDAASEIFEKASGYRDADNKIPLAYLEQGRNLVKDKQYAEAYELFLSMKDKYIDYFGAAGEQNGLRELLYEAAYYYGIEREQAGNIPLAIELYSAAGTFADAQSREYILRCSYAQTLIEKEDYAAAAEILKPVRSYENNMALWQDCAYKAAALAAESSNFAFAAERYLELGDYLDSEEKSLEVMYGYVQENLVADDENTYEYLCILRKQKYLDSAELYSSLYKWELLIDAISLSPDDRGTMQTKFALDEPVCFHFTLQGGKGHNERISYTFTYQNGYTQTISMNVNANEPKYIMHDNSTNLCYDTPGNFTVDFYDSKGNHIGHAAIEYLE